MENTSDRSVKLFVDSSVALAGSISATGASRLVFDFAEAQGWRLLVAKWVLGEVRGNLANKPPDLTRAWLALRAKVIVEEDEFPFDWPPVFPMKKDKPVLYTAPACAGVLLTLDRHDFQTLHGETVYGLRIETPGTFLRAQRAAGLFP